MKKKVIARFRGKGFSNDNPQSISHKSVIIYTSSDAHKRKKEIEKIVHKVSSQFTIGLGVALNEKQVDAKSIRISFDILDD